MSESLFGPLAHARRTDPSTSQEAAETITPKIRQLQAAVLAFAASRGPAGFIDPDLSEHFGSHSSTYRTRRSELVALGLIEDTGKRVGEGKGRRHAVWRITLDGYARHAELMPLAA